MKPSSAAAGPGTALAPDGIVEGYASLFGVEDQGRDVVMPGAFRASLNARGARGIRMLFQHDPAQPVGVWDDIREDARGLFVRGRIIAAAARGHDLLALLRGGAIDGLSIGFRARRAQRDAATGQRRLYDIDLWEISVVTFPMLPGARIHLKGATAKSISGRDRMSIASSFVSRDRMSIAESFVGRDQTSIAVPFVGRNQTSIASSFVRRDQTSIAAHSPARSALAAPSSPVRAARSAGSIRHAPPAQERREREAGRGLLSLR